MKHTDALVAAAVDTASRGFQPVPLRHRQKRSGVSAWTQLRWSPEHLDDVAQKFTAWGEADHDNLGVLLGEPSGGLVDVDLDHPLTMRLRHYLLPPTAARSGRAGRRNSHYWYRAEPGTLMGTRSYKLPAQAGATTGESVIEYRSTGAQTAIPPSVHPSGEAYLWEGEAWGGDEGPTLIHGRVLAHQVAYLALAAVLLDAWPGQGGRHEAYLALAGSLLRYGDGVHPWWERNLPLLISTMAEVSHDDDAPSRVSEVMESTLKRLREDKPAVGYGRLAEILGTKHVDKVRDLVREVEITAGARTEDEIVDLRPAPSVEVGTDGPEPERATAAHTAAPAAGLWEPVDLAPYLGGQITPPHPEILRRSDGEHLMYRNRINMLYGSSESGKTWISLAIAEQEIADGQRVVYLDFEDQPENTISRLLLLGAGADDIERSFIYLHPETRLAPMETDRWGRKVEEERASQKAGENNVRFLAMMARVQPSLLIVDGMTVLYGLHGLDTNDATSTDVITQWLLSLTRLNGGTTVAVIDHTTKTAERGSLPFGSQHKQAMVQGTMLQVWPISQPMPGQRAEIDLLVLKDRPGEVRRHAVGSSKAQHVARVVMDSTDTSRGVVLSIDAPQSTSAALVADGTKESRTQVAERVRAIREEVIREIFDDDPQIELSRAQIVEAATAYEAFAGLSARGIERVVTEMYVREPLVLEARGQMENPRPGPRTVTAYGLIVSLSRRD